MDDCGYDIEEILDEERERFNKNPCNFCDTKCDFLDKNDFFGYCRKKILESTKEFYQLRTPRGRYDT